MKKKTFYAVAFALALACGTLSGCSNSQVNQTLPTYDADGTIIRSAWWCPDPTSENYDIYKECGLNTLMLVNHNFRLDADAMVKDPVQHTKEGCYYIGTPNGFEGQTMTDKALAIAKEKGLDVILAEGSNYFAWVGEDVNVYKDFTYDYSKYKDVIVGVFSGDEPSAEQIPELAQSIPDVEDAFPDVPYFANLFPAYADSATALKSPSYSEYLKTYAKEFVDKTSQPRLMSVDVYPFIGGNYSLWLYNYELFTQKALEYDTDTHMFIQSAVSSDGSHRLLNDKEILVQVNTALAYGADAYSYFLYTPAGEGYPEGLVDQHMKPAAMYYHAQQANKQTACVEQAYQHYDYVNTIPVTGKEEDYNTGAFIYYRSMNITGEISESEVLTDAKANNRALIALLRDKDGNEAFYVTNYFDSEDGEIDEDCTISLTFDGMKKVALYGSADCLNSEIKDIKKGTLECTLAPGDGILIVPFVK